MKVLLGKYVLQILTKNKEKQDLASKNQCRSMQTYKLKHNIISVADRILHFLKQSLIRPG